ncbi:MAG TPA: glycosyltransferase family 39 protein, partial [Bryocella sp.]|nr:glycosyltransferase family 39 protein [Bryocella sp.]
MQLWSSVVQLSITSDEIDHLHAAYRYWQCNDFGWNPEHPPLVKIVAGLPLQAMHINDPIQGACGHVDDKATDFILGHKFVFANSESMLTAARFAVSLFPVLLLLAVWFFARKLFGLPVAILCGILLAFEPNILAHGALVTTDVASALGIFLAVYALYCYELEPNFSRLLALGLATGFALCAKHSTVMLAIILPALVIGYALLAGRPGLGRRLLRRAGVLAAAATIAMVVLWASYGFRYAARPGGAAIAVPPKMVLAHGAAATKIIPQLQSWRVAPQAYLVGLQDVLVESEVGRVAFILGKLYKQGRWFYFPVAAAIKFTLPFLVMVLLSAA